MEKKGKKENEELEKRKKHGKEKRKHEPSYDVFREIAFTECAEIIHSKGSIKGIRL